MRKGFIVVLAVPLVVVVGAALAYAAGYLAEVPAVILWAVSIAVDVVLFMLSWLLGKREEPHLIVEPLPHLKGWMRPQGTPEDYELYMGEEPRIGPKPSWGRPSDRERIGRGIHPAQVLELVWPDAKFHPGGKVEGRAVGDDAKYTFHHNFQAYKFGVISVTNTGAEAEHCSAHAKYRLKGWPSWHDLGELNWYSRSRRIALKVNTSKQQALLFNSAEGLNDVLKEPFADVSKNATKEDEFDLGLFYMLCEPANPHVFMCGAEWTPIPSQASHGNHLVMRIKIRFKARGMAPFTKWFRASVAPDDFRIWEESSSDQPL
jgi:hypothetical protein